MNKTRYEGPSRVLEYEHAYAADQRRAAGAGIVPVLEVLLARARSGEVSAVAIAALISDGTSIETISSATDEMGRLVNAVSLLERDLREDA